VNFVFFGTSLGFCKIGFREDRATFVARLKEEKGKTKKK